MSREKKKLGNFWIYISIFNGFVSRLIEIDTQTKKKSFKRSSTLHRGNPDTNKLKEYSKSLKKNKDKSDNDITSEVQNSDEDAPITASKKNSRQEGSRISKGSKMSRMSKTKSFMNSEPPETIPMSEKFPKITKLRNSVWYLTIYYV